MDTRADTADTSAEHLFESDPSDPLFSLTIGLRGPILWLLGCTPADLTIVYENQCYEQQWNHFVWTGQAEELDSE